jgi:hypothetical protein
LQTTTSATAPTTNNTGDIWFDTANGNRLNTWSGTAWVATVDAAIALAKAAAIAAQSSADGKNKIFRDAVPVGLVEGDIWFDPNSDNRPAKYTAGAWVSFGFGNLAVGNLDASRITTGYLAAGLIQANSIDVSVLTAGTLRVGTIYAGNIATSQITSGTLTAGVIYAGAINATQITAGTLTGFTIQTASSGKRLVLSGGVNTNAISFFDATNSSAGAISANSHALYFGAPGTALTNNLALYGDSYVSPHRTIIMDGTNVRFWVDPTAGVKVFGTTNTENALKNIRATFSASAPTGGNDGDIVLVYTP